MTCPNVSDLNYCSGEGQVLNDDYFNCWREVNCPSVFENAIFSTPYDIREYNIDGLRNAQESANTLLTNYFNSYKLTYPNIPGYNPFQVDLYNLCTDFTNTPGVCQTYLSSIESVCGKATYDQMSNDFNLVNWCSCFIMPDEQTKPYYDSPEGAVITSCSPTPMNGIKDLGNIPCYPLCHQVGSIQLYNPETGCRYECNSDVCIISDVTINQTDATGNTGTVNFTQSCPGCTTNNECVCIISGSDLSSSMAELGINSTFNQYCGYNAVCYVIDDTGNLQPVECGDYLTGTLVPALRVAVPWIFIGILIFIIIIVVAVFFAARNRTEIQKKPESNILQDSNI